MKASRLYRFCAVIILITNAYFIYLTGRIIYTSGGPMGLGLALLPILFSFHFFIYPAYKVLRKDESESIYGVLCLLGVVWIGVVFSWYVFSVSGF